MNRFEAGGLYKLDGILLISILTRSLKPRGPAGDPTLCGYEDADLVSKFLNVGQLVPLLGGAQRVACVERRLRAIGGGVPPPVAAHRPGGCVGGERGGDVLINRLPIR